MEGCWAGRPSGGEIDWSADGSLHVGSGVRRERPGMQTAVCTPVNLSIPDLWHWRRPSAPVWDYTGSRENFRQVHHLYAGSSVLGGKEPGICPKKWLLPG